MSKLMSFLTITSHVLKSCLNGFQYSMLICENVNCNVINVM